MSAATRTRGGGRGKLRWSRPSLGASAGKRWLERAVRLGYLVKAFLYGSVGVLALGVATRQGGATTDERGSLTMIASFPGRTVFLVVIAAGLAAYALWGFVRAAFDPLHRGSRSSGSAGRRLGYLGSGLSWTAFLIFTIQLLFHKTSGGESNPAGIVGRVLDTSPGPLLVGVAGAVGVLVGLGQFVHAVRADLDKDMERSRMSSRERALAEWSGRFGIVARGVIFTMVGWFMVQAALSHDASRARGFSGALQALAGQPLGHLLLGLVAVGFLALGVYAVACARWMRIRLG